jgi:hypothetical protein
VHLVAGGQVHQAYVPAEPLLSLNLSPAARAPADRTPKCAPRGRLVGVRIEKLSPERHKRRARVESLPRDLRNAVVEERHRLLTKWQRERRAIATKPRQAYGLATAIALHLLLYPRDSAWGFSMFQKRGGIARMRQISPQELRIFTRNGSLCSRTNRHARKAARQRELEAELDRKRGVGPDGVIPIGWYKTKP